MLSRNLVFVAGLLTAACGQSPKEPKVVKESVVVDDGVIAADPQADKVNALMSELFKAVYSRMGEVWSAAECRVDITRSKVDCRLPAEDGRSNFYLEKPISDRCVKLGGLSQDAVREMLMDDLSAGNGERTIFCSINRVLYGGSGKYKSQKPLKLEPKMWCVLGDR